MHFRDLDAIARLFGEIAIEAGGAILSLRGDACGVTTKADGSPLAEADLAADQIIRQRLVLALPGMPIVSEEDADALFDPATVDQFVLVDPLDGTREYIAGRDEFTVNIALVEHGKPVAGAVYAPALDKFYLAGASAYSGTVRAGTPLPPFSEMRLLKTKPMPDSGWRAVASRSHLDADTRKWIENHPVGAIHSAGSSLKFCSVAEGEADVYPRLGPTMEWDTAAGHAVLSVAGGCVELTSGDCLAYGKPEFRNPSFIAWARMAGDSAKPTAVSPYSEISIK